MSILFFEPIFMERIWGDDYFKKELHYQLNDHPYGEMWSLSAVKNNETIIINAEFKGMKLSEYFLSHKEQFNCDEFPLLIKLIHTKDLLSVQVHPDDLYAKEKEGMLGKTECWYFLDAKDDSFIYLGHHSKNKEELKKAIKNGTCEELLNKHFIKKDDFSYIPSKTIHALGRDLLLLEIQQSSDITYRLYDYNRLGLDGKPRALHVEKALDVIDFSDDNNLKIDNFKDKKDALVVDSPYFKIEKKNIKDEYKYLLNDSSFKIISVINGTLIINNHTLNLGESCLITNDEKEVLIKGNGDLLITYSK